MKSPLTRNEFLKALELDPGVEVKVKRFVPWPLEELEQYNDYWFRKYGIIRGEQDIFIYEKLPLLEHLTNEALSCIASQYLKLFEGVFGLIDEAHEGSCKPGELSVYYRLGLHKGVLRLIITVRVYSELVKV